MENNHFVYILRCNDETLYTGYTNNLEARLEKHQNGKGAKYTRGRGPLVLEAYEEFQTKSEALRQEYRMKRMTRKEKEQWIQSRKKGVKMNEGSKEL
ncbi:putative endonuclease [Halobacillus karajensis]|uniref:GIY-YIG nuclease superfamily protein n=1 Tax=Halobacillus karajensis TaxID=195088 RepID=A0A024PAC3_9BACI|nr:GIY-YIG nuclease family protein [Halobacillus karajensis]CDQ21762.1 GIY-YIG nuclease superfamily protein [Halobacillus karajensis]CDQ25758.1 GIY-YIG nuclease superfamily protein [Halobacillus karajensis]CDQ29759.1 GIY-YIG nuclease superfamily protein [Halobacillus karajensis]SEI12580.1 putative endonuclease [Halobacillus karajensis]